MVLFLFVVMMLDVNIVTIREGFARYLPVGIAVAVMMVTAMGSCSWLQLFYFGHIYVC